jgi:hypothetical protein
MEPSDLKQKKCGSGLWLSGTSTMDFVGVYGTGFGENSLKGLEPLEIRTSCVKDLRAARDTVHKDDENPYVGVTVSFPVRHGCPRHRRTSSSSAGSLPIGSQRRPSIIRPLAEAASPNNGNATSTLTIISLDLLTADQGELSLPSHRRPNTLSLP